MYLKQSVYIHVYNVFTTKNNYKDIIMGNMIFIELIEVKFEIESVTQLQN